MYRVAVVCEGPADREVILAILDAHLDDYDPLPVQPPRGLLGGDSGPLGGGWRGVKTWCEQESNAAQGFEPLLSNADLLIIQVDADVALEVDYAPAPACPPPSARADQVRTLVEAWLGRADLPARVVLCVPAMATETWVLVALYPDDEGVHTCAGSERQDCIECRTDIKAALRSLAKRRRPKLVVGQSGKLKNNAKGFAAVAPELAAGWPVVVQMCGEAARFEAELAAELP